MSRNHRIQEVDEPEPVTWCKSHVVAEKQTNFSFGLSLICIVPNLSPRLNAHGYQHSQKRTTAFLRPTLQVVDLVVPGGGRTSARY